MNAGAKLTALEARLETLAAKAYAGVSAVDRKTNRLRDDERERERSRSSQWDPHTSHVRAAVHASCTSPPRATASQTHATPNAPG
jgi:hypothetical protein